MFVCDCCASRLPPRGRRPGGRSASEANLLASEAYYDHRSIEQLRREAGLARPGRGGEGYTNGGLEEEPRVASRQQARGLRSRAASQLSVASRASKAHPKEAVGEPLTYRHDAPMLNNKYFPKDGFGSMANMLEAEEMEGFKYPHLQLRNLSYSVRSPGCAGGGEERLLDTLNMEARGGELVAVLATKSKSI